jgi:hypothetical protein
MQGSSAGLHRFIDPQRRNIPQLDLAMNLGEGERKMPVDALSASRLFLKNFLVE